jgi:hypothetical protein
MELRGRATNIICSAGDLQLERSAALLLFSFGSPFLDDPAD